MANLTCANLIATIRARSGRSNDSVLITTDFVLQALNEGQLDIVSKVPGLLALDVSDVTTLTIATDDTEKDLATLNPAHIQGIWILNGASTRQKGLKYLRKDYFFGRYIPVANQGSGEPTKYTRQGTKIIFNCPVASDYNGLYLRIDYTKWATTFASITSTEASVITNSNEGLILFGLARVYRELALSNPAVETKAVKALFEYKSWLYEFQNYNTVQIEELSGS